MRFARKDAYHGISECGSYNIARMNAGPEATYMAWRNLDRTLVGRFTFTVADEVDRIEAWRKAVDACDQDAALRKANGD